MEKIFYKLDWFTAMFENFSVLEVLDILGISMADDVIASYEANYLSSKGYSEDFCMKFAGCLIQIDRFDILSCFAMMQGNEAGEFLSTRFRRIRVDISGSGLDTFRSLDPEFDSRILTPLECDPEQSYHITRADFAFDLVNYQPEFLEDLIHFVDDHHDFDTQRVFSAGGGSNFKYSVRRGDQTTLYIGSSRSDKLLRVYDKKKQYQLAGTLAAQCPYKDDSGTLPDSWLRIELQCRNKVAQGLIYAFEDPMEILKYIYDNFQLRESRDRQSAICEAWVMLFDWSTIRTIIQNANSLAQEPYRYKAKRYVMGTAFSNIIVDIANSGGIDNWIAQILKQLHDLQVSDDPLSRRRWGALYHKLLFSDDITSPALPESLKFVGGVYELGR